LPGRQKRHSPSVRLSEWRGTGGTILAIPLLPATRAKFPIILLVRSLRLRSFVL